MHSRGKHTTSLWYRNLRIGWRNGSAVMNTCCSCGGPRFSPQHPHQMVHNRLKLQCQGHLGPLASMDSCPRVVIPNIHIIRNHTNKYFKRETLRIPCAWVRCELSPLSDEQSLPKGGVVRHVFSTRSWEHHLENFQPKDTILSKHLSLGNQNVTEVRWEDLLLSRV